MALATNHTLAASEVAAVTAALQTAPQGLTSFELQRALCGSTQPNYTLELRILMNQLRAKNIVKTTGQLRGMKYIWLGA
jgi:hypothetical protein